MEWAVHCSTSLQAAHGAGGCQPQGGEDSWGPVPQREVGKHSMRPPGPCPDGGAEGTLQRTRSEGASQAMVWRHHTGCPPCPSVLRAQAAGNCS